MTFLKRNMNHLWVSFVFSITLFLINPLSVYSQNLDNDTFLFKEISSWLMLFSIISGILLSIFVIIFSKRLKYLPLLLTALLFCIWIQGNFINYSLGKLDGHEIIWHETFKKIWFEILIWLIIFAITIIFRKILLRNNNLILVLILLLNTTPTIFTLIKNNETKPDVSYLQTSGEFEFSETNVIIIILDAFESTTFQHILEKYPEYQATFKDFIYFSDAIGGYTTTKPSIPFILTGEYYKNLEPINDYISSVENKSIPYQLKKHGYRIESYPYVPVFSSIYDNQTNSMPSKNRLSQATQQTIISGIRYSPLVLKPYFIARYYHGFDYFHKDLITFNTRVNEVVISTNKPMFKLFHFSGAHVPFQLDGKLNWNNAGYLEQAASSLVPVKNLLTELLVAGVYDKSLILIMGDHGVFGKQGYSTFPLSNIAQPLLLAKKSDQVFKEMQVSESPVTLGDTSKTIANETGIDVIYPGFSFFDKIPESRKRIYYFYTWEQVNWSTTYLPTLYEFEVNGLARLTSSWTLTGKYADGQRVDEISYGD
ncbi:MAG: hypothetical protein CVU93_00760, partial [Firmicutes bacterium HGW-Firmicutes-18]